jgi:hypothetical protein
VIAELVFAGLALAAVTTFALIAITSIKGKGKADVRAAEIGKGLEVALANEKTQSARADAEKERGDALDAAIAKFAADAVGVVDGSAARLLEAANALRAGAPGRAGASVVRDTGAAEEAAGPVDPARDSDLLRPGEDL